MIELRDLRKSYTTGGFTQRALDGVSVTLRDNEFVAILGPSGSGKTTLLNVIGGLDHADSGELVINGVSTRDYGAKDWDTYRNHHVGFVFQSYNLIPHQTILSNVELALTLTGVSRAERRARAREALSRVGLAEHVNKKPSQLSGGQMQRVAIARALVNDPDIVLADEPTGALDTETGVQVMDLLAEVARDRLVVMVTHNPDLAEQYATRIVNIADGRVTGDSDPVALESDTAVLGRGSHFEPVIAADSTAEIPGARTHKARRGKTEAGRHASMSFFTALSLSFANLMAKFGRTVLTAFAGSIGIMGIAAILALSNGVNNYIDDVQENVLSSSPLTITESSFDVTSIMTQAATYTSGNDGAEAGEGVIPESTIMSDILTDVKNNDLESFRTYLEGGESDIEEHVNAITYNYGITPLVYAADTSDGVKQLNPSTLQSIFSNGLSSLRSGMNGGSGMGFQEMLENQELLDAQYEIVRGRWPERYDECILVLSNGGGVSDYTLYSLGVLDPDVLRDLLMSTINSEEVDVPDAEVEFTFDDAMALSFKVVNACDLFARSEDGSTWTDKSGDDDFVAAAIEDGLDLTVVGIVQPRATASTTSLGEGIAYRHDLILHLMEEAGSSQIVREQLADPDRDVFTGKTFDELQDDQATELDMSSLFSVDADRITSAFVVDESKMQMDGIDPSAFDFSKLDFGDMSDVDVDIDEAAIAASVAAALAQNVPQPDVSDLGFSNLAGLDLEALAGIDFENINPLDLSTIAQLSAAGVDLSNPAALSQIAGSAGALQAVTAAVAENYPKILQGYIAYLSSQEDGSSAANYAKAMEDYLAAPVAQGGGKEYLDAIVAAAGEDESQQEATRTAFTKYLVNTVAPNVYATLIGATAQATAQATEQASEQMMAQMQQKLAVAIAEQINSVMGTQMAGLAQKIQSAISFDADVFASAIDVNMDQDDLTSLLTNYMNAEELTYDNNLSKLGYADEDKPRSISIFARSFEDKQTVEDIIAAYNDMVEAAGEEDKSISYSDITGVLMGSVTDIINMISLVLIAFVSVSLVVSSIMIGIITYISVLERRKEIGILRAMGASKFNIANIFNAETFIEGLFAGVLAIAFVLAASIPVNLIVERDHNVSNIMLLPASQAATLILISVVLTFIAGLAPSMAAARRDPVEALRSE